MYDFGKALKRQCLARIDNYPSTIERNHNELAAKIAELVEHNKDRLPNLPSDSQTNIPDDYIDDMIHYYLKESPRITALKAGDIATWENLLGLIRKRVYTNLRRYYVKAIDLGALAAETIQSCSFLIWLKLDKFSYDNPLDAWVSGVVAKEVRNICSSAGFRHRQKNISFEQPIHDSLHPDTTTIGDLLPDEQASQQFLRVDRLLTISAGFDNLSPEQRELVTRQLAGQTTSDIAEDMDCTADAVYKLRQRAVNKLRTFVEV